MRISFVFIGHTQTRCACREECTRVGTCLMPMLPTNLTNSHLHCISKILCGGWLPAIWHAVRQTAAKTSVLKSSFEIISSQREILFQQRISVSHHRQLQAKIQGMQSATYCTCKVSVLFEPSEPQPKREVSTHSCMQLQLEKGLSSCSSDGSCQASCASIGAGQDQAHLRHTKAVARCSM